MSDSDNAAPATGERLHALDAVRAWALLLGIVLHGAMSFTVGIPAIDNSPSTTLTVAFYLIHMFRMSLFYLVAGLFAHMMLHKRGWRAFWHNRLRRIGLPMVLFWFILLPLTVAPLLWGITRSYSDAELAAITAMNTGASVPLLHLWFLYYLLIFCALATGACRLLALAGWLQTPWYRHWRDKARALLGLPLAPLLLALPVAWQFLRLDDWLAWGGIPTHDSGLLPRLNQLVIYGTAFGAGWLVDGRQDILQRWQRRRFLYLAAALALSLLCLWWVGLTPVLTDPGHDDFAGRPGLKVLYASAYAIAIWCWCFALTGLALQHCTRHSPLMRYLADASYWLYLMHIPVIFFLQVLMMDWPLHWLVKFPLILILTGTLLLWLYDRWVRPGRLGALLNGRARPPAFTRPRQPLPAA